MPVFTHLPPDRLTFTHVSPRQSGHRPLDTEDQKARMEKAIRKNGPTYKEVTGEAAWWASGHHKHPNMTRA